MDNIKEEFVGILHENKKNMTVKQEGQKFQQYFCAIIVSIGALVIGNVLAWTSPGLRFIKPDNFSVPLSERSTPNYSAPLILQTESEGNLIAALTPLGAIIGALPAGIIADIFGRKLVLIVFSVPWIVTWIMTTFAAKVYMLYAARFISGIVVGMFCAVLPLYVNEIAEDSIRGTLGTLFQVFLTIGILIDYILAVFDSYLILCYTITFVNIAFMVGLFFIPESPIHLMKKNRKSEAEKVLKRLRGPYYDVTTELSELRKSIDSQTQGSLSLAVIFTRANVLALLISVGMMVFQQFSGINAVIFFAETIFKSAGASNPALCTIIVGIMQTLATVASSVLVDRAGRKILFLISSISMGLCLVVLGYYFYMQDNNIDTSGMSWLPLGSMVCLIVGFSLGLGPLPWMMSGEVLGPEVKSVGTAAAVAVNWICVSLVTFYFQPLMVLISRAYTFWLFAVICALSTVFVLLVVPETKGKSIQEVQDILSGKQRKSANGRV